MAVIQNISTEIGDVLRIQTDVPIIGILSLSSFIDETVGETGSKFFNKTFRYSVDGINYSAYLPLTNENLANIVINPTDTLILEYLYQRAGTDPSGELEWDATELEGEFIQPVAGPFYDDSMFAKYLGDFNNVCSLSWSINVLEKLYKKGIIPKYIDRGLSQDNAEDRDYIDFWRSISHYFALFVCLARYFKAFYLDPTLLLEYLRQRGLIFCNDTLYEDLFYAMGSYYDEIRKRGTIQIVREKNTGLEETSISNSISISTYTKAILQAIDGEYLRMICYDNRDEFIFNLNRKEHIGWNIGNSSPNYKGLQERMNCNKFYVEEIKHISDTVLFNPIYCTSDIDTNLHKRVLKIAGVPDGQKAGIGIYSTNNLIKVNPNIDYEFSFYVNRNDAFDNGILTFGCYAYDSNNNLAPLRAFGTNIATEFFFERIKLLNEEVYYLVRGIIFRQNKYVEYSEDTILYNQGDLVKQGLIYYKAKQSVDQTDVSYPPVSSPSHWLALTTEEMACILTTNMNTGYNLQFTSEVTKILPFIYLDNSGAGQIENQLRIHTVRLSVLSTSYSKGFIQSANFIDVWNTNRNNSLSEQQVKEKARKYLFPYKSFFKINFVEPAILKESVLRTEEEQMLQDLIEIIR